MYNYGAQRYLLSNIKLNTFLSKFSEHVINTHISNKLRSVKRKKINHRLGQRDRLMILLSSVIKRFSNCCFSINLSVLLFFASMWLLILCALYALFKSQLILSYRIFPYVSFFGSKDAMNNINGVILPYNPYYVL